jgi:hypothetical protein
MLRDRPPGCAATLQDDGTSRSHPLTSLEQEDAMGPRAPRARSVRRAQRIARTFRPEPLEPRITPTVVFSPQFGAETLTYNAASQILSNPPISLIFWGSAWNTNAAAKANVAPIVAGAQKTLASGYLANLKQYSPALGAARFQAALQTNLDPPNNFSAADVFGIVSRALKEGALPAASGLYLVLTPPGSVSADNAAGYHTEATYKGNQVAFGWVDGSGTLDHTTSTLTHELLEGITDPFITTAPGITAAPGAMWNDGGVDNGQEMSDYEANLYEARINGVFEQSYWSKGDNAYVIPDGFAQKMSVSETFNAGFARTSGTLVLNGDQINGNLNDRITLDRSPTGELQVTMNNEVVDFPAGVITTIAISPGVGTNNVSILGTPGVQNLSIDSVGNDTVTFGTFPAGTSRLGALRATVENISLGGATSDVINLIDAGDPTGRTVTLSTTNPGAGSGLIPAPHGLVTGLGAAQFTYLYANTKNVNIWTGNGPNTVNVLATGADTSINSGGTNDTVVVGDSKSVQEIQGQLSIEAPGVGRFNSITVDASTDVAGRTVTLKTSLAAQPPFLDNDKFGVIEGLAPAEIHYEYKDTKAISIRGTAGNDSFKVQDQPDIAVSVDGGGGTDSLIGPNQATTWNINGANAVKLGNVSATGFANLQGGAADDTFAFLPGGALTGKIDGGGGSNTLDYSGNGGNAVAIDLEAQTATSIGGGYNRIQNFIGSSSANDEIGGPSDDTVWNLTGANAGDVDGVTFSGIENVVAGRGADTFQFGPNGSLAGSLDGGGGLNWLDYSNAGAGGVTVNLQTGAATGVAGGISRIRHVIGSPGNDTLTGNDQQNILIGGAGDDTLTAGNGRSLLIGGSGKDKVIGAAFNDIVIGGSTTFDADHAALIAVLAEWARTDISPLARRRDLIKGGGKNGANVLVLGTTVIDDGQANVLTGSGGIDWFFKGANDTITDLQSGEFVNGMIAP